MSPITTHVLDTALGRPASNIAVVLEHADNATWTTLAQGTTDTDGRLRTLLRDTTTLSVGTYRLTFKTGDYYQAQKTPTFYPEVQIVFEIKSPNEHYHVPLLLSPFGYSTYRGS